MVGRCQLCWRSPILRSYLLAPAPRPESQRRFPLLGIPLSSKWNELGSEASGFRVARQEMVAHGVVSRRPVF